MPLTDNFDSYNDGSLTGQGSWTGDVALSVQGSITQGSSAKAIITLGSNTEYGSTKQFTAAADGNQVIWIYAAATNAVGYIYIGNESDTGVIRLRFGYSSSTLEYFDGSLWPDVTSEMAATTWYRVEIQWQASDDTARYRIGNEEEKGTWTEYDSCGNIWDTLDRIKISGQYSGRVYFDTLEEPSAPAPAVAKGAMPNFLP